MLNYMKQIKCIVWDLDNTLWEGNISENDEIILKDNIVEIIKTLDQRGILQSIASKNDRDTAIEVLEKLNLYEYFLYPEINWNAKSQSITNISKKLNLSIDSILFVDDLEYERDEVKAIHKDILCLDAIDYKTILSNPLCIPQYITSDTKLRRQMYLDDQLRQNEEEAFHGAPIEFLHSLNMNFFISLAQEDDLERAVELTERTHQLNSTGITYGYEDLKKLKSTSNHLLFICELTDKYGSYGKVGLVLVEVFESRWHIKLLLMSCRIINRGVGSVLLYFILKECAKRNLKVTADFKTTNRNRMMYLAFKLSNFKEKYNESDYIFFENDLKLNVSYPQYLNVKTSLL